MKKYYEENHEKILKKINEEDPTLEPLEESEVKLTKEEERIEKVKAII